MRRGTVTARCVLAIAMIAAGGCASWKDKLRARVSAPGAADAPAQVEAGAKNESPSAVTPAVATLINPHAAGEVVLTSAAGVPDTLASHANATQSTAVSAPAEAVPPPAPSSTVNSLNSASALPLSAPALSAPASDAALAGAPNVLELDLGSALQFAAGQNPRVAYAQARVREAYAQLEAAQVLWLPSLRAGMNYNKHEGAIQDVAGKFIKTSRGSIYSGMGALAVGAASPAVPGLLMNFHLRDALYNPKIAERVLAAQRRATQAATNDVLLETSLAYIDLLEAVQIKSVAYETLANAGQLADLTGKFARAGQGLDSDADRSQAEFAFRRVEAQRAVENLRVASARLARLLSQDQSLTLLPDEPAITPIEMVTSDADTPELVAIGLSNRPELAESQLLVGAAVERLRRERHAPWLPSLLLGVSYGGNGGGLGSNISGYDDRLDCDVAAFWEVRNLGLGEQAQRDGANSRVQQATFQRVQVMDQVAAEIAEAHAQVESRREQIAAAQAGIVAATESFQRNTQRIDNAQGLPIEALQAIQALDQARRQYVRVVCDYNRAQFRLHRALGWPILAQR